MVHLVVHKVVVIVFFRLFTLVDTIFFFTFDFVLTDLLVRICHLLLLEHSLLFLVQFFLVVWLVLAFIAFLFHFFTFDLVFLIDDAVFVGHCVLSCHLVVELLLLLEGQLLLLI